jgi:outer membrane immunogenic protein
MGVNMRTKLLGSAAAIAIIAVTQGGPTLAADLPVKATRIAPVASPDCMWCGLYVGGHVGYGWSRHRGWDSGVPGDPNTITVKPSGGLLGFHAGYNWQFGRSWVFGIEGDYSALQGWKRVITTSIETTSHVRGEMEALASIRGRLGWAFDRTLIYATGGVAWARHRTVGVSTPVDNQPRNFRWATGGVVGGGIEWKYNPQLSFRLEGLHYMFSQTTLNAGTTGFGKLKSASVVRIGLSWHPKPF